MFFKITGNVTKVEEEKTNMSLIKENAILNVKEAVNNGGVKFTDNFRKRTGSAAVK